jgi:hypothetical protein
MKGSLQWPVSVVVHDRQNTQMLTTGLCSCMEVAQPHTRCSGMPLRPRREPAQCLLTYPEQRGDRARLATVTWPIAIACARAWCSRRRRTVRCWAGMNVGVPVGVHAVPGACVAHWQWACSVRASVRAARARTCAPLAAHSACPAALHSSACDRDEQTRPVESKVSRSPRTRMRCRNRMGTGNGQAPRVRHAAPAGQAWCQYSIVCFGAIPVSNDIAGAVRPQRPGSSALALSLAVMPTAQPAHRRHPHPQPPVARQAAQASRAHRRQTAVAVTSPAARRAAPAALPPPARARRPRRAMPMRLLTSSTPATTRSCGHCCGGCRSATWLPN